MTRVLVAKLPQLLGTGLLMTVHGVFWPESAETKRRD